jgi:hypothetical protein
MVLNDNELYVDNIPIMNVETIIIRSRIFKLENDRNMVQLLRRDKARK